MTLAKKVLETLEQARRRGELPTEGAEAARLSVQHDSTTVTVEVVDCDRLGYLVNAVVVEHPPGALDAKALAEGLMKRVTYLSEDLTLVELGRERTSAILRSVPQQMRAPRSQYFELSIQEARALQLHRHRPRPDVPKRREAIAFHLTPETLLRLVDDLDAGAAPRHRPVEV